jgi:hypothetical protein
VRDDGFGQSRLLRDVGRSAASPRAADAVRIRNSRRYAILRAERGHERGHLVIGQCGTVLHLADLGARRQQLVEMTAPSRRVLALAVAARRRRNDWGGRSQASWRTHSIRARSAPQPLCQAALHVAWLGTQWRSLRRPSPRRRYSSAPTNCLSTGSVGPMMSIAASQLGGAI